VDISSDGQPAFVGGVRTVMNIVVSCLLLTSSPLFFQSFEAALSPTDSSSLDEKIGCPSWFACNFTLRVAVLHH
jgi:hypothetical protein